VRVTFATSAANIEGLEPVDSAVLEEEADWEVVDELVGKIVVEVLLVVDDCRVAEVEDPVAQLAP
jgi:hypothetical protein